jgi:hypothetical protein
MGVADSKALEAVAPVTHGAVVTPDDATDLTTASRAILVGTAGDIKLTTVGGSTLTAAFTAGWHPVCASRIWSTGTTAAGISAWW